MKKPPNHYWPIPAKDAPFIKRGEYEGLKSLYDEERRRDLQEALEKQREVTSRHQPYQPARGHF